MFKIGSVCKDKTREYLGRAICHMTPDRSLCSPFCGMPCSLNMSASRLVYLFFMFHCVLSFSFIHRKVRDSLPLFRQFFSSAFSLTYVSLASMKLPPDVLRYLTFSAPRRCLLSPCLLPVITGFFTLSPQGSPDRINFQPSYQ